ncbi:MAG TPA: serine/threonine-protein kinase [Polyangiales bacterium]
MMSHAGLSTDDPLIGSTIAGRYRIQARVGSGAMGAVYRAVQSGLGRPVALKVLKRDLAWGGDTVQRFRREAQAMSALNHPNTVRVFDFGATDEGLLYLAMELLEGEPVTERLAHARALSVKESVLLAQQVLRSVGEAHVKGIVHRDLKPDNIFLARVQGEAAPIVKVLDFGIAKAVEGERKIDQFETLDGTVFGTPRYMAPEQAAGKALDPRTDLYAVGIILYEFLAGQPPFVDTDAVVVMAKHIREAPVPLCKAAPQRGIPRSLEAVVSKALEKDAHKRFQSADEFDQALAQCLPEVERLERNGGQPSLLDRVSRVSMVPRDNRGKVVLAVAAAAVLLGLVTYALWPRPNAGGVSPVVSVQVPAASEQAQAAQPGAGTTTTLAANTPAAVEPKPAVVTLQTEPSGAEVWRNGMQLGVTPLEIVVPPGETTSVSLHKPGYVEHTVEVGQSPTARTVALTQLPAVDKPATQPVRPQRARHGKPRAAQAGSAGTHAAPDSPYEKF